MILPKTLTTIPFFNIGLGVCLFFRKNTYFSLHIQLFIIKIFEYGKEHNNT